MELSSMRQLALEARANPNYQFRDLTDDKLIELASQSFKRLPDAQQEKVTKSWINALVDCGEQLTEESTKELLLYRFLAQTNLFFLCNLLEKYRDITVNTHEDICNKFFVQKNPVHTTFEKFATQYTDLKDRMLLVPRGGFKALDLDTLIPTPNGMVKMNDIRVGDTVYASNGKQCLVTGESQVFVGRDCYSVEFSTGESIVADADHLWVTDSRKDRDRLKGRCGKTSGPKTSVKTTKEIADTLLCREERNHRVAVNGPLENATHSYTVSPYVLGCWLGDGTSSSSNFTGDADTQIVDEISREGEVIRKAPYGEYLYVLNGGPEHPSYRKHSGTSFASKLRTLGLIDNKHIPEVYFHGSHEQRLSLLQGLMDTDGSCDKRGHCTFVNTNKILIYQVRRLISSLGFKPFNICEYRTQCNGKDCGLAYAVGFKPYSDTKVFRLDRKQHRVAERRKSSLSGHRQIVGVERVESRPTKCIMVDSDDHTYLVGESHIVTHNSSIDMADCVQYIICWPAITILILTGTLTLATDFVGEIKQHFTLEESGVPDPKTGKGGFRPRKLMDKETGAWSPSMFQVLFPEHCTSPGEGKQTEFQTPAGGDEKEPTVRAASIEQALSGAHFCVMKLDDVVTNENSLTVDRLEKVNKQISINRAMLHPYGFFDVIGTWYDEKDYYGKTIKQEETFAEEEGLQENIHGSVDSGRFNSHVYVNVYLRACWWFTKEAKKSGKIESEATKSDYEIWFPERLPYEFLVKERKTYPDEFPIKYLNDPRKLNKVKFPRELLVRRTISHNQLPQQGVIVTTVDTAYSTKSWADFTVIMTSLIYGGRFYIINMKRGRYNEYELPAVIAATAHKWKPKRIAIEDSVGVKWMGRELRREMDKLQISVPVEFVSLGLGSKSKAKAMKAKPVLRLLGDERMYFSNSCEGLEEIYSELEKFTGTNDDAHDDIVSAISLLAEQFQAYADMGSRMDSVSVQYASDQQAHEIHSLIYGLGKYARFNQNNGIIDDNPVTAYQIENSPQLASSGYVDPLSDLLG